jgi:hypothetical protein
VPAPARISGAFTLLPDLAGGAGTDADWVGTVTAIFVAIPGALL